MNPHMEALGFTLVHFCWQAALIAAAYKLAEMIWPKLRPQSRYMLGLGALLAMCAAAMLTFLYEEIRLFQPAPTGVTTTAMPLLNTNQTLSLSAWLPWLDAVWLIGVLALTFRMITSLWQVYGLKKQAQSVPLAINDRFSAALKRFGLTGKVQVRLHPAITGPFVVGAFRSVVYLPLSAITSLSPAQLDAVLAHELEHIRRADYLWNLIQSLVETLFFYHPAVWWIGAKLREQRELCCDDAAISHCDDPITYATALLSLEEQRRSAPSLSHNLVMALNGQGRHELLSRISRILGEKPEARLKVRPVAFVLLPALLLTLTAFAAAPVTKAAGKICPQKVASATTTASLAMARVQAVLSGQPTSFQTPEAPLAAITPDGRNSASEWQEDQALDAIAADARADALRARDDLANAKDIEIDPQALAAEARSEAMKAKAEMERQGIAHTIDPDAIAAQVLAETQRAKADVARAALASIDPDAIAAQARAAAVAAKAQYAAQKAASKAEWARQKAENQRLKNPNGYIKEPLPPLPPVPPLETPAPVAPPESIVAPVAPISPLAPVAADWPSETRILSNGKALTVLSRSKTGILALQTLDKLPNARPAPIPSPDPSADVIVQAKTIVHVEVDTKP